LSGFVVESGEGNLFFEFQKIDKGGEGFHPLDGLVVDGQDDVSYLKPGFLQGPFEIQPENGHSLIGLQTEFLRFLSREGSYHHPQAVLSHRLRSKET
jgi:hypothetical protein